MRIKQNINKFFLHFRLETKNFSDRLAFFNANQKKKDNKPTPKTQNKNPPTKKKEDTINGKIENKGKTENNQTIKKIEVNTNGAIENKKASKEESSKDTNILNNGKEIEKEKTNKDEIKNKINTFSPKEEINTQKAQKEQKNEQELKNINKSNTLVNQCQSKIGYLINQKHPIYGSNLIKEIKGRTNSLFLYNYPLNIEYSSKEESIAILFVGQSGTGKSTFINAYVNHLLGITSSDNIRYQLIFGDKKKENDQTQSQTDSISIYNIRSLKYNNKLFKLIDTPGAGDTRNDNEQQTNQTEKDKKEKEFLVMYEELFKNKISQLNSIIFVVKASENRENEFQKRIVKNITNLFADGIGQNCLSILTHTDNFDIIPDAVQLMEKMDIFKKKSQKNEEWYFTVSSTSYFIPFTVNTGSSTEPMFRYTEASFIAFTKKLLTLKIYYTKETQKNLELKNRQETIIKILKENILVNLLSNIIKLKDTDTKLNQKIAECEKKEKEIEYIKNQVNNEEKLKEEIKDNIKLHSDLKNTKAQDLEKNKQQIQSLNQKNTQLEEEINGLKIQQQNAENEQKIALAKKEEIQKEINSLKEEINKKQNALKEKQKQIIDTKKIEELQKSLDSSQSTIDNLVKEINLKKEAKDSEQLVKLKESLTFNKLTIQKLNEEIVKKRNEGETEELKKLQNSLKEAQNNFDETKAKVENEIKTKDDEISKLEQELKASQDEYKKLNIEINNQNIDYNKEIEELKKFLNNKMKESDEINKKFEDKKKKKEEYDRKINEKKNISDKLKKDLDDYIVKENQLQAQLQEEENELKKHLEKQKELIGLENINNIKFSDEEGNDMMGTILEKINEQIKAKMTERNSKIKYNEKILVEDDKLNLICNVCKNNCHLNCECWKIVFWKPVWVCESIKSGNCLICKSNCHKDKHERIQKKYIDQTREKSLSPNRKNILDKEILNLQDSLVNISTIKQKHLSTLKIKEETERDKKAKKNEIDADEKALETFKKTNEIVSDSEIEQEQNKINKLKTEQEKKEKQLKLLESMKKKDEKLKNKIDEKKEKMKTIEEKKNIVSAKEKEINDLKSKKITDINDMETKINELNNNEIENEIEMIENKKKSEIETKENEKKDIENKKKNINDELQNLLNKKESKEKEEKTLNDAITLNENKKKINEDKLSLIKIDENKIETLKQTKDEKDKEKEENKKKILEEEKNKKLNEEEIKKENEEIKQAQKKLDDKDLLIKVKKEQMSNLTNILDSVYKNDRKRLEEEKKKIEKDLYDYKRDAIKQFLTIKIINEEISKLTLNKSTINSVTELITDLSTDKRFIKNIQYFDEIIKEYENVVKEIDNSKGHEDDIYKRYIIDPKLIRNLEKKK